MTETEARRARREELFAAVMARASDQWQFAFVPEDPDPDVGPSEECRLLLGPRSPGGRRFLVFPRVGRWYVEARKVPFHKRTVVSEHVEMFAFSTAAEAMQKAVKLWETNG